MNRPDLPNQMNRPDRPGPMIRPDLPGPMIRPDLPGPMIRPDLPGPMKRRGPRPLALHLALASNTPLPPSAATGAANPSPPDPALIADAALIAGIAAYRRHPYQRTLPDPASLWTEGESRLLDYAQPDARGPTVVFVPSLVNRAYILDLAPGRSLMRFLGAAGVRAALLDWGWPGPVERRFNLTDYIAGRLERAVAAAAQDGPVVLVGYCMGGLMALAAAQRRPDRVAALALLATPWDFHAADPGLPQRIAALMPVLEPALSAGTLPIDALQSMFAQQDAGGVAAKFRAFAAHDPASEAARMFVALEDWLADGVPLAAPVARDCLGGWYGANEPAQGTWRIAGDVVDPRCLRMPCFVAMPDRDRIVPPESARPLARMLYGATLMSPAAGHVAMIAGSRAPALLWEKLLGWLRSRQPLISGGPAKRSRA